jgi:hypothetical protein
MVRSYYLYTLTNKGRTIPCQPSATTFSIYSQLHSISGGRLLHPQLLGKHKCIWDDYIKIDLEEDGGVMDWINLAQDMDKSWPVMNFWVPFFLLPEELVVPPGSCCMLLVS